MRPRPDTLVTALLGALLVALLYGAALASPSLLATKDAADFFFATRVRLLERYAHLELPLWDEKVGCGTPALADPVLQVLYPGNALLLLGPPGFSLKLFLAAHCFAAVLAGAAAARSMLGLRSSGAAAIAGLVFMGGGIAVGMSWMLTLMAAAPFVAIALAGGRRLLRGESGADGRTARDAAIVATSLALAVLAGGAELVYGLLLAFAAEAGVAVARGAGPVRARVGRVAALAGAGALAVLLAAAQIVPTLELAAAGTRAGGVARREAAVWSLHPGQAVEMVVPFAYGNAVTETVTLAAAFNKTEFSNQPFSTTLYWGAGALALAAVGALGAGGARPLANGANAGAGSGWARADRRLALLYFFGPLVLALGEWTPIYGLCYAYLPGFALFRYPTKMLLFSGLALGHLAALGAEACVSPSPRAARLLGRIATAAALALAVAAAVIAAAPPPVESFFGDLAARARVDGHDAPGAGAAFARAFAARMLHPAICGAVLAAAAALAARRPAGLVAALAPLGFAGLIALDLGIANRGAVITGAEITGRRVGPPPLAAAELRALAADGGGERRIARARPLWHIVKPQEFALMGYRDAGAYGAHVVARPALLRNALAGDPERYYRLIAACYVLERAPEGEPPPATPDEPGGQRWRRLESPFPRAVVVRRATRAQSADAALWRIQSGDFDPALETVIEGAPPEAGRGPLAAGGGGAARIIRDDPTVVEVEVDVAPEGGTLVLLDTYYPGWEAYTDGAPRPIYRANVAFRGVTVPPGRHIVRFEYRPWTVQAGAVLSGVGLLALGICLLRSFRAGGHGSGPRAGTSPAGGTAS